MAAKEFEAEMQEDCLAPAGGQLLGILLGLLMWTLMLGAL